MIDLHELGVFGGWLAGGRKQGWDGMGWDGKGEEIVFCDVMCVMCFRSLSSLSEEIRVEEGNTVGEQI